MSVLNVRGGNLKVITTDDSISAGMHLELSGGRTYAYSRHDDAVDSNGTLTIAGGVLVAISHAPVPKAPWTATPTGSPSRAAPL